MIQFSFAFYQLFVFQTGHCLCYCVILGSSYVYVNIGDWLRRVDVLHKSRLWLQRSSPKWFTVHQFV